ncbi:dTDP-4-amino-4,6-dideoxygalactose transaminase [Paenibacillus chitinolyticus]|uniref:dTDP-4-amino-4,6-dideoxygalactose transaminase n=1 Tax=Paenibacillus chitinolyticus TaxID=79263 RepID=UPI0026E4F9F1|nr:dTDP-4-amino-4,6-dideoxygalactose transaminase [Paenibacillus chitinolyticus]GKS11739.1 dTDP-4-amino-4,6-dideoxygalactose transaminase [Paenibacillus chitinolyticus]
MIPFNKPLLTGQEDVYIREAIESGRFAGDGPLTGRCSRWLEDTLACDRALLTTSCTHALEMAAMLLNITEGDEIIVPSFTFVSTTNAFVLRGAKLVFVDIRPDTLNMNEQLIEKAITNKTKAIVPVHYAGVSCEMDTIMKLANQYNLVVIEDAAHALMSRYRDKYLGTIGHLGCFSFHESKNYQCGEGGALIINDKRFIERAEVIREKGTNRTQYLQGEIDRYTWVDIGSSYLLSELNAAFLFPQLLLSDHINADRTRSWQTYYDALEELAVDGKLMLPGTPRGTKHNGHIFYVKVNNQVVRNELMTYLKHNGVSTASHYIPLHSSDMGKRYGFFHGEDIHTTSESEKILRLPMFYGLDQGDIHYTVSLIKQYFKVPGEA